ncbi:MAG: thiolase family protein [Alicyclobacillus sp.]|nr:thiolase family protein [Alicyclobacillus sp.]
MEEVVVVAAKRTAIAKQGGGLREVPPEQLAAVALRAALAAAGVQPAQVEEVVLGNVVGPGGNLARLTALTAGLPLHVPGVTVDAQCGSGLQAVHQAALSIRCGQRRLVAAGGTESVSRAPWRMEKPSSLYSLQPPRIYTRARFAPDWIGDPDMGVAAETVARIYGVSRAEQDAFALRSHRLAVAAQQAGDLALEIAPCPLPDGRTFDQDEEPRPHTSLEKLARLSPVFVPDGTVTAGNACGINDGAAVVLLAAASHAAALGLRPVLRLADCELVGVDPNVLGIGPVPAIRQLLQRHGLTWADIDLIEINEAFAAQVLACVRLLELPMERLNVCGGALALGHPYGASGAVLVTRLFYQLPRRGGRWGVAALGVGGGLGIASLWECVGTWQAAFPAAAPSAVPQGKG